MDKSDMASSPAHDRDADGGRSPRSDARSSSSRGGSPTGSREGSPRKDIVFNDPRRSTKKLVVQNLSPNTTSAHLEEVCRIWGEVVNVTFSEDAKAPCAIVEFSQRTEAQDALDHMHRMSFDHTEILVSFTVDSDPKTATPLSAYGQVSVKDFQKRSAERKGSPRRSGRDRRSPPRGRDRPPRSYSPRRHYDRDAPRRRTPPGRREYRDYDHREPSPPRRSHSPSRYDSHRGYGYDPRGRSPPRDSYRGDRNRGRSPVRRRSPSPSYDRRRSPTRGHYGSPEPKRYSRYSPHRSPEHSGR